MNAIESPVVACRQRGAAAGFTRLEYAVTMAVTAILLSVFLERAMYYRDEAERVQMLYTVAAIRTALQLKTGELERLRQGSDPAALAAQNPLDWLQEKPPNYLGELDAPARSELRDGNWYFDRKKRVLVYLLREGKIFSSREAKPLFFKVELLRLPTNPARPLVTTRSVVLNQVDG